VARASGFRCQEYKNLNRLITKIIMREERERENDPIVTSDDVVEAIWGCQIPKIEDRS
jgi:hypothetical protein